MSKSMRDLYDNVLEAVSLLPAVRTTGDTNGTGVNVQDYDSVLVLAHIGAPGDALSGSVKIQFRLEEADDVAGSPGSYTPVAAADIQDVSGAAALGTNGEFGHVQDGSTGNNGSQIIACGYKGNKEWLRVVHDGTGTQATGTPTAAMIVRGHPHRAPTRAYTPN